MPQDALSMPPNAPSIFAAFPEAKLNIFDLIKHSYNIKNKNGSEKRSAICLQEM
jgi:hypothetical protein